MPKYLVRANYVGDGIKGLMSDGGTKREAAARASVESVGGTMEAFYYAFGEVDVYGIGEFPDDATATAWSLTINATDAVMVSLVPLMEPAVLDAASQKTAEFRPPGS